MPHFDFHSCFNYAKYKELQKESRGQFQLHQKYAQADDNQSGDQPPVLAFPLALLTTVRADAFIGCFCEIFQHSKRFAGIQRLSLRGCDELVSKQKLIRILRACQQITELDLSFMKRQVDQEVLFMIGDKYSLTLEVLELRACSQIDDRALVGMACRLADLSASNKSRRQTSSPTDATGRIKIKYLNLSCLPIREPSVKAIQDNLVSGLQALNLWGCAYLPRSSIVSLCSAASQARQQASGRFVVGVDERQQHEINERLQRADPGGGPLARQEALAVQASVVALAQPDDFTSHLTLDAQRR